MAQQRVVTLIDDIDGTAATQSHTVTFNGTTVTIDLNDENSEALVEALRPYLDAGTKVTRTRGTTASAAGRSLRSKEAGEIRAWARENGLTVSERGRISEDVRAAYEARARS